MDSLSSIPLMNDSRVSVGVEYGMGSKQRCTGPKGCKGGRKGGKREPRRVERVN